MAGFGYGGYNPTPGFKRQPEVAGTSPGGAGTPPPAAAGGALTPLAPAPAGLSGLLGGQGGPPGGPFGMGMPIGAWGGFANGQIPLSAMRSVYGMYVAPNVADNLMALLGAAQKAGVWNPGQSYASGTYRPLSVQERLWQAHLSGQHPAPVARPGTSNHGWGEAIDFNMNNSALIHWLAGNAGRFGFYDRVGGEPWHYSSSGN